MKFKNCCNPEQDNGNMLTRAKSTYTWDAENRLVSASNLTTAVVCNFVYDHQSRRISKTVLNSSLITQHSSFIYDGWNLIYEQTSTNTSSFIPHTSSLYLWGLDLSGTLQGAGGVGGLLSQTVIKPSSVKRYFPLADANGNCVSFIDEAGNVQVYYTYDAFGNTVSQTGNMADDFRFRFSSKYLDDETGLYYYGYRYYAPAPGRWVCRDPVEEAGGLLLYCFVSNRTLNNIDYLGMWDDQQGWIRELGHCSITYKKEMPPAGRGAQTVVEEWNVPAPKNEVCDPEGNSSLPGLTCSREKPTCKLVIYIEPGVNPDDKPGNSTRSYYDHELAHAKCHEAYLQAIYSQACTDAGKICCTSDCRDLRTALYKAEETLAGFQRRACSACLDVQDARGLIPDKDYENKQNQCVFATKKRLAALVDYENKLQEFNDKCKK